MVRTGRLGCDFFCMSSPHLHRLTRLAGCMPETAAKPGGLYLILRGAFLDAKKRILYLNKLRLRPFIIVLQPLLLLVKRHQNGALFYDLYRDLLSGIKPRRAQPLAGKDDIYSAWICRKHSTVSHNF